MEFLKKLYDYSSRHIELFTVLMLGIIFYFIFFHAIGTYPLMDVDETRYVSMARDMFLSKDFSTLYLNGEYFFEKPPLYFWQECLSFAIFGKINEFSARFPVALLGFIFSFVVYFFTKKRIGRNYGIITSLVLATSLEFVMLAKYAILDIVLAFYAGLSLIMLFQTYFCEEKHKKYYWWGFYLFSGLAVMAKGIPGFVIPFGTAFFCAIITKRFKEIFKPLYVLPGMIIFLIVVLPWHILMFNKHNPLFFDEYIIKHHLHRFLNTANNEIGRKQPFYYYLLTILWGFMPWAISTFAIFIKKISNLKNLDIVKVIKSFDFEKLDNIHKLLTLSWIGTIFIFLFFSSSSTKLVTYILPIYFPLSMIAGYYWENYINKKSYEKPINLTVNIFGWICIVASIAAIFTPLYLPHQLYSDIEEIKWFMVICLLIFGICSVIFTKHKKYLYTFILYVLFITSISAFATDNFFKIDYKFGQNDLIEFAKYCKDNNLNISTYSLSRKYSLIYYYNKKVNYNNDIELDEDRLKNDLNKENTVVILKTKDLEELAPHVDYTVIKQGRRYTMLKK